MNPMEEVFHIWSLYTFQSFCVSFCGRMDMCLWVWAHTQMHMLTLYCLIRLHYSGIKEMYSATHILHICNTLSNW